MTTLPKLLLIPCLCGALISSVPAAAGDHLACYPVKDTIPKQKIPNVSLLSSTGEGPNQTACTVATGARLCCDAVDKVGVPPQPGGAPSPGPAVSQFCCYKVKCPAGQTGALVIQDQFGSRTLPVTKPPKMICAPDVPSPTTTTTTTLPSCATDTDCAAADYCSANACVVGCRLSPDNCGPGLACGPADHLCHCSDCTETNPQLTGPHACFSGGGTTHDQCVLVACEIDTECPRTYLYCSANACVDGCRLSPDNCPGGLSCDAGTHTCL